MCVCVCVWVYLYTHIHICQHYDKEKFLELEFSGDKIHTFVTFIAKWPFMKLASIHTLTTNV